ncbi:MAG: hypothetical protein KAT77_05980 [Nanoarchaeota archaeon]|nr:hypothetical protein [Nanoarchaeota archaeon]
MKLRGLYNKAKEYIWGGLVCNRCRRIEKEKRQTDLDKICECHSRYLARIISLNPNNDYEEIRQDIEKAIRLLPKDGKEVGAPVLLMEGLVALLGGRDLKRFFTENTEILKKFNFIYKAPEDCEAYVNFIVDYVSISAMRKAMEGKIPIYNRSKGVKKEGE